MTPRWEWVWARAGVTFARRCRRPVALTTGKLGAWSRVAGAGEGFERSELSESIASEVALPWRSADHLSSMRPNTHTEIAMIQVKTNRARSRIPHSSGQVCERHEGPIGEAQLVGEDEEQLDCAVVIATATESPVW